MSAPEIFIHATSARRFLDATPTVAAILANWDELGFLPGDALCCVSAVSANAQLLVSASKPEPGDYVFEDTIIADNHEVTVTINTWDLNKVFLRTSEIFMIRGPTILASRHIYVLGDGNPVSLL